MDGWITVWISNKKRTFHTIQTISFLFLFFPEFIMLKDPVKRRIALSYGFDWLLVIIMTVVFFAIDKVTPFHRQFSINDKTIMFPYAEHERVPVWLLLVS